MTGCSQLKQVDTHQTPCCAGLLSRKSVPFPSLKCWLRSCRNRRSQNSHNSISLLFKHIQTKNRSAVSPPRSHWDRFGAPSRTPGKKQIGFVPQNAFASKILLRYADLSSPQGARSVGPRLFENLKLQTFWDRRSCLLDHPSSSGGMALGPLPAN